MLSAASVQNIVDRQRRHILRRLDRWLEAPMALLGFIWLILLGIEFVQGLSSFLEAVGTVIWIIFALEFTVRLGLAPDKTRFVRQNWLTALALALPALRLFRFFRAVRVLRAARAARGLRLVRLLTSLNRGMKALGKSMRRRGFGYVALLTCIVTLAGSAGMYAFEDRDRMPAYTDALWWTAMLMTTMGSEVWPKTGEGRLLCLVLALYAFAVFGYVTATIATFFIGRDADSSAGEVAGTAEIQALRAELRSLRTEIMTLTRRLEP